MTRTLTQDERYRDHRIRIYTVMTVYLSSRRDRTITSFEAEITSPDRRVRTITAGTGSLPDFLVRLRTGIDTGLL